MKRILIFCSHFPPAYKAGGPVQSIHNMVKVLKKDFIIDVVCSARDLGERQALSGIEPDRWNAFDENINVYYIDKSGFGAVSKAIRDRNPDTVYINGVFLPLFNWMPLLMARLKGKRIVFSPRGMLQAGALAAKSAKKQIAISLMKALRLHHNVLWHATDEQEGRDIVSQFGEAQVVIAGNVPAEPLPEPTPARKASGELHMVFLSLIAEKKNLDFVLETIRDIDEPVSLDIYGPVKDRAYWERCLSIMRGLRQPVRYLGPLRPAQVRDVLRNYHAFVLLTKGENFGHAIYEALSAGTPAILSPFTPWGNLQEKNAGVTVDIGDRKACVNAIRSFVSMDQAQFDVLSRGASALARHYYDSHDFRKLYTGLFSTPREIEKAGTLKKVN